MFPFAELVENYFIDEEQDSLNREAENPVEVLMKTYYSQSYSECSDDNPLATDIRNSFSSGTSGTLMISMSMKMKARMSGMVLVHVLMMVVLFVGQIMFVLRGRFLQT